MLPLCDVVRGIPGVRDLAASGVNGCVVVAFGAVSMR